MPGRFPDRRTDPLFAQIPSVGENRPQTPVPEATQQPSSVSEDGRPQTPVPEVDPPANKDGPVTLVQGERHRESSAALSVRPKIAGYEIQAELGRGASGIVYKALEAKFSRIVALKVIISAEEATSEELLRFINEARIGATLLNQNIVQVYDTGHWKPSPKARPVPYFTMEYCDGGSLAAYTRGEPQSPSNSAKLVETIARAIHLMHEKGIIHRDLKPGNIMLSGVGAAQHKGILAVEGTEVSIAPAEKVPLRKLIPKISDLGLAKRPQGMDSISGLSITGVPQGTPEYMPPEQARGEPVTPAADVYALGAILYELLTGRPPFRGASQTDTLVQVLGDEPVPIRQFNSRLPIDLETICTACLQKDPKQRYASALELAEDLRRFQANEPISRRPISWRERTSRWVRKHPTTSVAILGLVCGVLFGTIGGTFVILQLLHAQAAVIESGRQQLELSYKRDQALQLSERTLTNSRLRLAQSVFDQGDALTAHDILQEIPASARGWAWRLMSRVVQGSRWTFDAAGPVRLVLADARGEHWVAGCDDGTVQVWSKSGEPHAKFAAPAGVTAMAMTSAGDALAIGTVKGNVIRLAFPHLTRIWAVREQRGSILAVQFNSDSSKVFSVADDNTLRSFGPSGESRGQVSLPSQTATCAAFDAQGKYLILGHKSETAKRLTAYDIRDLPLSAEPRPDFTAKPSEVFALAIRQRTNNEADKIAVAGLKRVTTMAIDPTLSPGYISGEHTTDVTAFAFSRNTSLMASADREGRIVSFDLDGNPIRMAGHFAAVTSLAYSSDDKWLISGSEDGKVKIWRTLGAGRFWDLRGAVSGLSWAEDGSQIYAQSPAGRLSWTLPDGEPAPLANWPEGLLMAPATDSVPEVRSADGKYLAKIDTKDASRIILQDSQTHTLRGHRRGVRSLLFTPDSKHLISAGEDGIVRIWDVETQQELIDLRGHTAAVRYLAISKDGSRLLSGGDDGRVYLWDGSPSH